MTRMNEKFLNNLLNSISVSGYEEQVQDIVTEEMKEYTDEIRRDEMQNLTCILNPENDVRIMLSAHADEIGLMISNIREDGRLQVELFRQLIRDVKCVSRQKTERFTVLSKHIVICSKKKTWEQSIF